MSEKKNEAKVGQADLSAGSSSEGKGGEVLRIGAAHGEGTVEDDTYGYARDISPEAGIAARGDQSRITVSKGAYTSKQHPSRRLELRSRGYGIGGGYERPYRKEKAKSGDSSEGLYGPLPHAGYYGAGEAARPFKVGQATFQDEISWYENQYCETTSGYEESEK